MEAKYKITNLNVRLKLHLLASVNICTASFVSCHSRKALHFYTLCLS